MRLHIPSPSGTTVDTFMKVSLVCIAVCACVGAWVVGLVRCVLAANETLRRARCVVADALREVESARAGFFRSDEAFHSAPAGDWIGAADGADIYAGEEFFNPGVLCLSIWLCCFLLAVLLPPSLPH